jgi:hypothetical protein
MYTNCAPGMVPDLLIFSTYHYACQTRAAIYRIGLFSYTPRSLQLRPHACISHTRLIALVIWAADCLCHIENGLGVLKLRPAQVSPVTLVSEDCLLRSTPTTAVLPFPTLSFMAHPLNSLAYAIQPIITLPTPGGTAPRSLLRYHTLGKCAQLLLSEHVTQRHFYTHVAPRWGFEPHWQSFPRATLTGLPMGVEGLCGLLLCSPLSLNLHVLAGELILHVVVTP